MQERREDRRKKAGKERKRGRELTKRGCLTFSFFAFSFLFFPLPFLPVSSGPVDSPSALVPDSDERVLITGLLGTPKVPARLGVGLPDDAREGKEGSGRNGGGVEGSAKDVMEGGREGCGPGDDEVVCTSIPACDISAFPSSTPQLLLSFRVHTRGS